MTIGEFHKLFADALARDFGENPPQVDRYEISEPFRDGIKVEIYVGRKLYCMHRVLRTLSYSYVTDIEWFMPVAPREPGQPCLAFKGINKFLRKRGETP